MLKQEQGELDAALMITELADRAGGIEPVRLTGYDAFAQTGGNSAPALYAFGLPKR